MAELDARIRHAEAYPYQRPAGSYLFVDGAAAAGGGRPLRPAPAAGGTIAPAPSGSMPAVEPALLRQRSPVIAAGSNAAPARLAAKFAGSGATIPVTRAALADHAVVHAAHFSSYGAVPATLYPCPGALTEVFVTWLTATQLDRMHATEGVGARYAYVELAGLRLTVDGHGRVARAGAYLALNGALASAGRPVRLAAVPSQGCGFAAETQPAVLRGVHRRLAPAETYRAFMARIVDCSAFRTEQSTALGATALPWSG